MRRELDFSHPTPGRDLHRILGENEGWRATRRYLSDWMTAPAVSAPTPKPVEHRSELDVAWAAALREDARWMAEVYETRRLQEIQRFYERCRREHIRNSPHSQIMNNTAGEAVSWRTTTP